VAVGIPDSQDLGLAFHVHGHNLPLDPVAEPQSTLMSPWRLGDSQASQQYLRVRHRCLLALPGSVGWGRLL
jgi:hypothetical protein